MRRTGDYETSRLKLRRWTDADRSPFAAMNADAEVMKFMPGTLDRVQSDALVDQINRHFDAHGFGLWAVEISDSGVLIGCVGLQRPAFASSFAGAVEISWRLARNAWGQGFATEAALAACRIAFTDLELPEIVSFTVPHNERSRRVMERLAMVHAPEDDFDHPRLPDRHPLRRHVLYRLERERWVTATNEP